MLQAQPGMLFQKLVGEGAPFKVRAALVDKPSLPVQDGKSFELEFRWDKLLHALRMEQPCLLSVCNNA